MKLNKIGFGIQVLMLMMFLHGVDVNAQSRLSSGLEYDMSRIYPSLSAPQAELASAQSIAELNPYYKSKWVREFKSVEVVTTENGQQKIVGGSTEQLTDAQLKAIASADIGTEMSVLVRYLPDNNLGFDDVKEFDFDCVMDPERDAVFDGGSGHLEDYLESSPMGTLTKEEIRQYLAAIVTFAIDTDGEIVDAKILQSSESAEIDQKLLDTVCDMPNWTPAEYRNQSRVKQEFALMVGDMYSCTINQINVKTVRERSRQSED